MSTATGVHGEASPRAQPLVERELKHEPEFVTTLRHRVQEQRAQDLLRNRLSAPEIHLAQLVSKQKIRPINILLYFSFRNSNSRVFVFSNFILPQALTT